jgi:Fur family transcriptional regulator, ferric uptake regulator
VSAILASARTMDQGIERERIMQQRTTHNHTHLSVVEIEQRLKHHGYRLTAPRSAVVAAVLRHDRPFSAEQLVNELSNGTEAIGRATVYRTLEVLASMDVLTRIVSPDGHPSYISGAPGHRHHLLCETCGITVTITSCPMTDLLGTLAKDTAFLINDHTLEVFGICPSCQRANHAKSIDTQYQ